MNPQKEVTNSKIEKEVYLRDNKYLVFLKQVKKFFIKFSPLLNKNNQEVSLLLLNLPQFKFKLSQK